MRSILPAEGGMRPKTPGRGGRRPRRLRHPRRFPETLVVPLPPSEEGSDAVDVAPHRIRVRRPPAELVRNLGGKGRCFARNLESLDRPRPWCKARALNRAAAES
jgi:hypothetical protein